ncbi:hypothetical protein B5F07_19570 [Lachnoclostridium sp. An169]|uniref:hypothetical protein n=1 Tax=Lachnoclostridium sp. An169 TaxID=1965569 RepID=UPI000B39DECC|nr:hypothetical protein [Lachnoclostridium sp. An169]OUP80867.1 hypothetical protein B5F07_19570 [Lachnoclostridium sp. An169]HJA66367.1 hypothetical protein [Candidatus Mediterraneibacter cottocaccae]
MPKTFNINGACKPDRHYMVSLRSRLEAIRDEFYEAEKRIVKEDNPLYESLLGKLKLYPELKTILYELLFSGRVIPYTATNDYIKDAAMFGFIKNENDTVVVSNRIFETVLYNNFISDEFATNKRNRSER